MSGSDYILDLLEAKGWYLYKGIPHASMPQLIRTGKVLSIEPNNYYHLIPATTRDADVGEVAAALANAVRTNMRPKYDDNVNRGPVDGIHISDSEFAFLSGSHSFTYPLGSRSAIENAIKFNLSNYNTFFFESIDEIGAFLIRNRVAPQLPSELPSQVRWTFAHLDDDPSWVVIHPDNASPVSFRGQGKRFKPCLATATRGMGTRVRLLYELSAANQARLIVNIIRTQWFIEFLRETRAAQWLKEHRIVLDEMAVAQHYGLPTGYLDLTQSFEVAAFFACCHYHTGSKSWTPISEGEGVIYVVDLRTVPLGVSVRPINLQVFPRPSEQWGWTHELSLGDDFDMLPWVGKFVFKHDAQASQRLLAKFSYGKDLFPDDPLSELAEKILTSPVLPTDIAEKVAKDVVDDPQGKPGSAIDDVLSLVREFSRTNFSKDVTIPEISRIKTELDNVWSRRQQSFFKGVGMRLVRTLKDNP